jgi:hypothetical protein
LKDIFLARTDGEIYSERKKLGELLTLPVLEAVDYDLENRFFPIYPIRPKALSTACLKHRGIPE